MTAKRVVLVLIPQLDSKQSQGQAKVWATYLVAAANPRPQRVRSVKVMSFNVSFDDAAKHAAETIDAVVTPDAVWHDPPTLDGSMTPEDLDRWQERQRELVSAHEMDTWPVLCEVRYDETS